MYFLQPPPFLSTTLGVQKICGTWFNAAPGTNVQATACTYANPFKVGVHFDGDDNIILAANAAAMANVAEHGFAAGAAATDVSGDIMPILYLLGNEIPGTQTMIEILNPLKITFL